MHAPGDVCPGCGGRHFSPLGEDVTEILEKLPARLKVIRHVRPKLSCRACSTIMQAPSPDLPITRGRPGPELIAQVVVGKYLDALPLYRQSAMLAREGIEIERATLADWVGHAAWWVAPLAERIGAYVRGGPVIHTDDTPVAMLAPGQGRTRTGRLWTYLVDERPWCGDRAPAAWYRFSPDRKGERPREHLADYKGVIQADAYSGYTGLYDPARKPDPLQEAGIGPSAAPMPVVTGPQPSTPSSKPQSSTTSIPRPGWPTPPPASTTIPQRPSPTACPGTGRQMPEWAYAGCLPNSATAASATDVMPAA